MATKTAGSGSATWATRLSGFFPCVRRAISPPLNRGASGVALTWTTSDDTALQGVHIDRAPAPTGPWTRLAAPGSPHSGNTYLDTPPSPGDWTYSVRAVKLETTPCGTYLNPSLGATITVQTGTASAALAITTTSLSPAALANHHPVALQATGGSPPYAWSLVGGTLPAGMTLSENGVISGAPTRGGVTHQPVFQVSDFRGATAQLPMNWVSPPAGFYPCLSMPTRWRRARLVSRTTTMEPPPA